MLLLAAQRIGHKLDQLLPGQIATPFVLVINVPRNFTHGIADFLLQRRLPRDIRGQKVQQLIAEQLLIIRREFVVKDVELAGDETPQKNRGENCDLQSKKPQTHKKWMKKKNAIKFCSQSINQWINQSATEPHINQKSFEKVPKKESRYCSLLLRDLSIKKMQYQGTNFDIHTSFTSTSSGWAGRADPMMASKLTALTWGSSWLNVAWNVIPGLAAAFYAAKIIQLQPHRRVSDRGGPKNPPQPLFWCHCQFPSPAEAVDWRRRDPWTVEQGGIPIHREQNSTVQRKNRWIKTRNGHEKDGITTIVLKRKKSQLIAKYLSRKHLQIIQTYTCTGKLQNDSDKLQGGFNAISSNKEA